MSPQPAGGKKVRSPAGKASPTTEDSDPLRAFFNTSSSSVKSGKSKSVKSGPSRGRKKEKR